MSNTYNQINNFHNYIYIFKKILKSCKLLICSPVKILIKIMISLLAISVLYVILIKFIILKKIILHIFKIILHKKNHCKEDTSISNSKHINYIKHKKHNHKQLKKYGETILSSTASENINQTIYKKSTSTYTYKQKINKKMTEIFKLYNIL